MKLNIVELRDMVAAAVRETISEAKKAKVAAPRSEESIAAQRANQIRALPGYAHGEVLDMSKPLGKRNRLKRQGAANMGSWTSESSDPGASGADARVAKVVDTLVRYGVSREKAARIAPELAHGVMAPPPTAGLDDPSELGIQVHHEAVRRLVRLIVAEEIRVARRGR